MSNWEVGGSINRFSENFGDEDLEFDIVSLSIGYQSTISTNWRLTPELRIGAGYGDETIGPSLYLSGLESSYETELSKAELTVDRLIELSLRVEYHTSSSLYFYGGPSYSDIEISTEAVGPTNALTFTRSSQDEFGLGIGVGIKTTKNIKAEIGFKRLGDDDMFNLSFKYKM